MKNTISIEKVGVKIANQVNDLLDYAAGKRFDRLSCKEDVELNLKILNPAKDWYDKTVNQQGNLVGLLANLSESDKDYIFKLKLGELELQKRGAKK